MREITKGIAINKIRFQSNALGGLQETAEVYLISLLKDKMLIIIMIITNIFRHQFIYYLY